jgi:hypothetical protein
MEEQPVDRSAKERYLSSFSGDIEDKPRMLKALELALDIRKFEIEMYWKRAAYFWVFTGAAFGAYLTISGADKFENRANTLLLVSCVGLVFSIAWYFVNRASKYWQENWEAHVDLLEDAVIGPLYKTVLRKEGVSFWHLNGAFPFSVSKLNQLLSLFSVFVFALLVIDTQCRYITFAWSPNLYPAFCILGVVIFVIAFCWTGKTSPPQSKMLATLRDTELTHY